MRASCSWTVDNGRGVAMCGCSASWIGLRSPSRSAGAGAQPSWICPWPRPPTWWTGRHGRPPRLHPPCAFSQAGTAHRAGRAAGAAPGRGLPVQWVANHRRHHAARPGGRSAPPLAIRNGICGPAEGDDLRPRRIPSASWSNQRFAPDLLADRDLRAIGRFSGVLVAASLLSPRPRRPGHRYLGRCRDGFSGPAWDPRGALLHHVTWSVNSVCQQASAHSAGTGRRTSGRWPSCPWARAAAYPLASRRPDPRRGTDAPDSTRAPQVIWPYWRS